MQEDPSLGQNVPLATPKESEPNPGEDITYVNTGARKPSRRAKVVEDDENFVDTTVALAKKSKKTVRAQRRLEQKQQKSAEQPKAATLLDLPPELLEHILGFLRPSDIFRLLSVSRAIHDFVDANTNAIARDIIRRRYWVLSRCFPLPVALRNVDSSAHAVLMDERRLGTVHIHTVSMQNLRRIDPQKACSCLSCILAWNNLCMVLDLAHWQNSLDAREPLPIIPRGSTPDWNKKLLEANAAVVETAFNGNLLFYSMILEKHLQSTMRTLLRTYRGKKTIHPKRLYHFTIADANSETDEFLERSGPPSYEYPWLRDNYYALEAYVPNRKWSKERQQWIYYADGLHERDLQWLKDRYLPKGSGGKAFDKSLQKSMDTVYRVNLGQTGL